MNSLVTHIVYRRHQQRP